MRKLIFLLVGIGIVSTGFAQQFLSSTPKPVSNPKVPLFLANKFKPNKELKDDFEEAMDDGNFFLLDEDYTSALAMFLNAYNIDPTSANINYLVGYTIMKSLAIKDKSKAIPYLERAGNKVTKRYNEFESDETSAPYNTFYYLGLAYNTTGQQDNALKALNKFKDISGNASSYEVKDADRIIGWCTTAKEMEKLPINVNVTNLGDSVNSIFPDYSAMVSGDENTLIFSSKRDGTLQDENPPPGTSSEYVYYSYKKKDGTWSKALPMGDSLTTPYNEASVALSPDGQQIVLYKEINGGDLFVSHLNGKIWSKPVSVNEGSKRCDINTDAWETSASISSDGNTIYFISDRKGGLGGRDVWKSSKLPNGQWSMATNLGAPINTPYDEEAPFLDASGKTMYFSSNGPKSMGGFDIFSSDLLDNGKWSEPKNIGVPINTTGDDVFYVTSPDGKRAYFSSVRKEGYGDKDIYIATTANTAEKPLALIKGRITNEAGEPASKNIVIEANNMANGSLVGSYKPLMRDGSYIIIVPANNKYKLSFKSNGVEFYAEMIEVPENASYHEVQRDLQLKPVIEK